MFVSEWRKHFWDLFCKFIICTILMVYLTCVEINKLLDWEIMIKKFAKNFGMANAFFGFGQKALSKIWNTIFLVFSVDLFPSLFLCKSRFFRGAHYGFIDQSTDCRFSGIKIVPDGIWAVQWLLHRLISGSIFNETKSRPNTNLFWEGAVLGIGKKFVTFSTYHFHPKVIAIKFVIVFVKRISFLKNIHS